MLNSNQISAKLKETLPNVTTEKSRSCFSFFCCNEISETLEEKTVRNNQQKFNLIAIQVAQKLAEGKDVVSSDFTVVSTNKTPPHGISDKTHLLAPSINAGSESTAVICQQSEPYIESTNDEESKKRNLELFIKALYLFSLDHETTELKNGNSEKLKAQFPHVIIPLNPKATNEISLVEFCKNNIGIAIFGAKKYAHVTSTHYGATSNVNEQHTSPTKPVSIKPAAPTGDGDLAGVGSYYKPGAHQTRLN